MMTERAFYSVKEFCERNGISKATFYRLRLPVEKLGRRTLVPIDSALPTSIPTTKRETSRDAQRRPETPNGKNP